MIGSLPLGFAQPLVLIGLIALPVLWWLLRLVPPRPRRLDFPPTRLLFEIAPKEETPARTPWWLVLLRLTLAALAIIAAAGPLWNPPVASSIRRSISIAPWRRRRAHSSCAIATTKGFPTRSAGAPAQWRNTSTPWKSRRR